MVGVVRVVNGIHVMPRQSLYVHVVPFQELPMRYERGSTVHKAQETFPNLTECSPFCIQLLGRLGLQSSIGDGRE